MLYHFDPCRKESKDCHMPDCMYFINMKGGHIRYPLIRTEIVVVTQMNCDKT